MTTTRIEIKRHWRIVRGHHAYSACGLADAINRPLKWSKTDEQTTCDRCWRIGRLYTRAVEGQP